MTHRTLSNLLISLTFILTSCSTAYDFRSLKAETEQFPQSFSELRGFYETVDSRNDKPYGITKVSFDRLTYDQLGEWKKNPQLVLGWRVFKSVKPTDLINSTFATLDGDKSSS